MDEWMSCCPGQEWRSSQPSPEASPAGGVSGMNTPSLPWGVRRSHCWLSSPTKVLGGITLIPLSTLSKMDWKASSFIRKWLCLPLNLFECCLFRRNILQLPLQSITIDYKREKTRLSTEMTESTDQAVRSTNVQVCTGYKWKAHDIDQVVTRPSSGPQCFSKSMDNERYKIKAAAQGHKGSWSIWQSIVCINFKMADLWRIQGKC